MSGDRLAYTFTNGIRAGICVSPFPASSSSSQLKMPMSFLGSGHRRSSLGPNNISPNSPPCSSCLHSNRQPPSIPPLEGKTNTQARGDPITGEKHILKFSPRSEGDSGPILSISRSESDIYKDNLPIILFPETQPQTQGRRQTVRLQDDRMAKERMAKERMFLPVQLGLGLPTTLCSSLH